MALVMVKTAAWLEERRGEKLFGRCRVTIKRVSAGFCNLRANVKIFAEKWRLVSEPELASSCSFFVGQSLCSRGLVFFRLRSVDSSLGPSRVLELV